MHKFVEQIPSVIIRERMLGKSYLKKKFDIKDKMKRCFEPKVANMQTNNFLLKSHRVVKETNAIQTKGYYMMKKITGDNYCRTKGYC